MSQLLPLYCYIVLGSWIRLFIILHNTQYLISYIVYLFIWILMSLSTHSTSHITMGSFIGRGNQYLQLVKVLYCKLPTNGMQLLAFPLNSNLRGGRRECYHSPTVAPYQLYCDRQLVGQRKPYIYIYIYIVGQGPAL